MKYHLYTLLLAVAVFGGPAYSQSNPIQIENQNAGTTDWQIANPATNREIEGYASLTSVNIGGSINLFVSTADPSYTIDVFRIGWYGGLGGRRMLPTITRSGGVQTTPAADSNGTFECVWSNPYVLSIPTDWVSGIFLARLTGSSTGLQSYIIFLVRDDSRSSTFLYQSSVTTFEAYNNWPGPNAGGKSLYGFNSSNSAPAVKVSFNRPYFIDTNSAYFNQVGAGFFLRWEVNMVRWLEMSGYDVTYCTNIDVHENAALILQHRGFLVVGHDEYWSWEMRANVEAARDHGAGIAFFASNVCYWQIRLEPSAANGFMDRTIVGYKTTATDPTTSKCLNTVLWRQNTCKPSEQSMIGVEFIEDGLGCPLTGTCLDVVIANASHWALAGSGLTNGSHLFGILGYEVDGELGSNSPPGTSIIAHSPIPANEADAKTYPFSDMTSYVAPSGATVFATGTMQWTWGLDGLNAPSEHPVMVSTAVQTITSNVLANLASSPVTPPGPPVGDEFNGSTLNSGVWSFSNPVGNGTYNFDGSDLVLAVPAGSIHDLWTTGNTTARIMQPIANVDFDVVAKVDSMVTSATQIEGIVVQQTPTTFLRFEFRNDGNGLSFFAASVAGTVGTFQIKQPISGATTPLWLRVTRSGNTWTGRYSLDGTNYVTAGTFTYGLAANSIGLYAGNWGSSPSSAPALTARFDYFRLLSSGTSAPALAVTKSHTGSFSQGGTGSYTITVSNSGTASTSGTVTVTDTLPAGLSATAISGTGWTCTLTPSLGCTRSDSLAAGSNYASITLSVNVAANAPSSVTNSVTVSGGGASSPAGASDPTTITSSTSGGGVSDEFNSGTLNTSVWTFVNPVGNGSYAFSATDLLLTAPGGSNHDPQFGGANNTVRVVQNVPNAGFQADLKFDSLPSGQYAMQGLLVEQDAANYLRFEVYSSGSTRYIFAGKIVNSTQTVVANTAITVSGGSVWLRVVGTGTNWTLSWSADGTTFTTASTFTQSLAINQMGPYAGNYASTASNAPAFTAAVDYFHYAAQP